MNTKRDTTSATNSMSARFRHRIGRVPLALLALLALALAMPVREASGQGTVRFDNRIPGGPGVGITLHIWGPSTNNPALALVGLGSNDTPSGTTAFGSASGMALIGAGGSGGHYGYATTFAQLIGAVGSNQPESALVPVGQTTTFRSGSFLGEVASITDTLSAVPPYTTAIPADAAAATFEIVAWDNSSGLYSTWVQASAAWQQGLIAAGHSAPFTVTNLGDGIYNPPPYLNNSQGTNNDMTSFNLSRFGPTATTLWALQVKATTAQIWGSVNPNGKPTSAWFEWGATPSYGNFTSVQDMGSGNSDLSFGRSLGPLTPGTTYYFRVTATNSVGQAYGDGLSFTTQTLPTLTVTTLPATDVNTYSAKLNGTVYGTTEETFAYWEFGTTTNYGSWTGVADMMGDGPIPPYNLGGLTAGTTYHFRAMAHNNSASGYGSDQSFTTLMPPAFVINTGSGYWDAASSTLSYAGNAGSAQSFILLQSADPTAPLSAWTRVATNGSIPGSFSIPPVGTAAPAYYRVKSE